MKNRSEGEKRRRLALAGDVRLDASSEFVFLQSTLPSFTVCVCL